MDLGRQCHPYSEWSTVLHFCQLLTDFHNISIVYGVWASIFGSSQTTYGML